MPQKREAPATYGSRWRIMCGEGLSMAPAVRDGEKVLVDAEAGSAVPGDVVAFRDVIHRVIWVDPNGGIWERGDADGCRPRRRRAQEVDGVAVAVAREGHWIDLSRPEWPMCRRIGFVAICAREGLRGMSRRWRRRVREQRPTFLFGCWCRGA